MDRVDPTQPATPPLLKSEAPPDTPLTRFCPQCGAAWDPLRTTCIACERTVAEARARAAASAHSTGRPIRNAILLYFAILVPSIAAAIITVLLRQFDDERSGAIAELVATAVSTGVVLIWSVAQWPTLRPALINFARPRWYFIAVAFAVLTVAIASVAVDGLTRLVDIEEMEYAAPMRAAGFGWWLIILTVCIQPAIIEELTFRGFILTALQAHLSNRDAIIVSSLMFMVIHLTVPSFPHLFLIGLALGYLRVRSGSLYPCMLMHFLHNLAIILLEMR